MHAVNRWSVRSMCLYPTCRSTISLLQQERLHHPIQKIDPAHERADRQYHDESLSIVQLWRRFIASTPIPIARFEISPLYRLLVMSEVKLDDVRNGA